MNSRDGHGDAPLSLQMAILLVVGFAILAVYALPDLKAWARGQPPVDALESCQAEIATTRMRANQWADAAIRAFALAERAAEKAEHAQQSAVAIAKRLERAQRKERK